MKTVLVTLGLLLILGSIEPPQDPTVEEVAFTSGPFRLVGDLRLPSGTGPHPVVVFVHGDGPNDRTSWVTYPPIMERMHRAGYATFAWDKPGTGESTGEFDRSRLFEERTRVVLDAIEVLKARPDIDAGHIGLWGISQGGYIMARVLSASPDVAFIIAASCPGEPGYRQGAFLLAAQAVCVGLPPGEAPDVERSLEAASRAQTYEEYVRHKSRLGAYPALEALGRLGIRVGVAPEDEWEADDLEGRYFWDPMEVMEETTIPVLAFFGERDTQADPIQGAEAYRAALERAGNTHFRVELLPGADHNLIRSETGCLEERSTRSASGWTDYVPEYLDILEEWLRGLSR